MIKVSRVKFWDESIENNMELYNHAAKLQSSVVQFIQIKDHKHLIKITKQSEE